MHEHERKFVQSLASVDQAAEHFAKLAPSLAKTIRSFYESLVAQGFSSQEALALTIEFQRNIWSLGKR